MISPILAEKILKNNKYGYAVLSPDYTVVSCNSFLSSYLSIPTEITGKSLFDILPETVGLESHLKSLKKQKVFTLRRVNRQLPENRLIFFDLSIYATKDSEEPFVILLRDVTEAAEMRQRINQQRHEILLLESRLKNKRENLFWRLLGDSPSMQETRSTIEKVSQISNATILFEGESGTGKSLAARMVHYSTPGKEKPFVEISCAAIPETLLEAELFGYQKGAFTGANRDKTGLLEEADGGTLFLDEIGELPLKLQVKLLSFLENKKFRRLGSNREIEVKLRLITATNRNLSDLVKRGEFREDLHYRLNVVNIKLPPLRMLGNDIILISQNYIDTFNLEFGKKIKGLAKSAQELLLNHRWPGNVRELRNVIERAMIFSDGPLLEATDLILDTIEKGRESTDSDLFLRLPSNGYPFHEIEKKLLQEALKFANGNQVRAARLLHMSRDTFRYRCEKHHLL